MINMLPKTEKDDLKKGLKLRFVIMASLLSAGAFLIGFVMLVPSYLLSSGYFGGSASDDLSRSNEDESIKELLSLPVEIDAKLGFFRSSVKNISVADYLSRIVEALPPGVKLKSLSFSRSQNFEDKIGTLISVSGQAANRDSLISFSNSLRSLGLFSAVEVPVSSLTKDRDLPFSIDIFIEQN